MENVKTAKSASLIMGGDFLNTAASRGDVLKLIGATGLTGLVRINPGKEALGRSDLKDHVACNLHDLDTFLATQRGQALIVFFEPDLFSKVDTVFKRKSITKGSYGQNLHKPNNETQSERKSDAVVTVENIRKKYDFSLSSRPPAKWTQQRLVFTEFALDTFPPHFYKPDSAHNGYEARLIDAPFSAHFLLEGNTIVLGTGQFNPAEDPDVAMFALGHEFGHLLLLSKRIEDPTNRMSQGDTIYHALRDSLVEAFGIQDLTRLGRAIQTKINLKRTALVIAVSERARQLGKPLEEVITDDDITRWIFYNTVEYGVNNENIEGFPNEFGPDLIANYVRLGKGEFLRLHGELLTPGDAQELYSITKDLYGGKEYATPFSYRSSLR